MKPSTPTPDVVLAATTVAVVRQIGHMAGSSWAVMTVTAWIARFRQGTKGASQGNLAPQPSLLGTERAQLPAHMSDP